ncbi:994_t:CDS:2 [Diversispora eburnea]|uniref:994_t:CDS:1 n=1 Tax=Diversispora eburnea TaxID=1213867 RepID=A0A9N8W2P5_9GLOM|nr:994_t:CDS:2 [Diversispora eburnea]
MEFERFDVADIDFPPSVDTCKHKEMIMEFERFDVTDIDFTSSADTCQDKGIV